MSRLALTAALLALVACGGAPTATQKNIQGGTTQTGGSGSTNTTLPDGGTEPIDAGTPAPPVVTYSLDCTGSVLDAQLTYHYESRDDGHVLTDCSGVSPEGRGEGSFDWAPDAGDLQIKHDEGACYFDAPVAGGVSGEVDCVRDYLKDTVQCWYYDSGNADLNGTKGAVTCEVTTPTP